MSVLTGPPLELCSVRRGSAEECIEKVRGMRRHLVASWPYTKGKAANREASISWVEPDNGATGHATLEPRVPAAGCRICTGRHPWRRALKFVGVAAAVERRAYRSRGRPRLKGDHEMSLEMLYLIPLFLFGLAIGRAYRRLKEDAHDQGDERRSR